MAKKSTKSASERAQESRAAKIAAGYAAKSWLLSPAAQADLATIVEREECTEGEAVEIALAKAVGKGREPSELELARALVRKLEKRRT